MKLSVAAIVKDETSSLLEWIAYHRVVGVDSFFIADNGSTDGTSELLEMLEGCGIVKRIPFPTPPEGNAQMPAYTELLKLAAGQCDLLAFIDADEYILPMDGSRSVMPLLLQLFSDPDVGAIGLNWAIFGSGGNLFAEDGLVIERFTRRAQQDFGVNHHIKSIVRPERAVKFANPHYAVLAQGRYVDTHGQNIESHPKHGQGLTRQVQWQGARINHYATKSLEEFLLGKSRRGSAARRDKIKHRRYFLSHDKNDETCLLAQELTPDVRKEMVELERRMASPAQAAIPPRSGWRNWAHRVFPFQGS